MSQSSPGPVGDRLILTDEPEPTPEPRRHTGLALAGAVGLLAGGLLTWAVFSALTQPVPPLSITQESFPLELLDMRRQDYHARTTGHEASVGILDKEFESQVQHHRFSYGGDGATYMYYRGSEDQVLLTIVNGVLNPHLPSGDVDSRVLMDSDVRCTGMEYLMDARDGDVIWFKEDGTTQVRSDERQTYSSSDCVLHDAERGVSLRIRDDLMAHKSASQRVEQFADALRDLHADLVN